MIIEPKDFAGETRGTRFRFGGASGDKIIAGLLKLIAAITDQRVLVEHVSVKGEVAQDDYVRHELTLRYAERETSPVEAPSLDVGREVDDALTGLPPQTIEVLRAFGVLFTERTGFPPPADAAELAERNRKTLARHERQRLAMALS